MTSRLRRKRPTTARSFPTRKATRLRGDRSRPGAARLGQTSLIFAILAALATAGARAEEKDLDKYPVKQTSYSTGPQGSKLAWLPYRPATEGLRGRAVKSEVTQAQFETPAEPKPAVVDPKKDPFGDGVAPAKLPTIPPTLKPEGGLLDRLDAQLLPPDSSAEAEEEIVEKPSPEQASDGSRATSAPKSLPSLSAKDGKDPTGGAAGQDGGPQLTPGPNGNEQRVPTLDEELATNIKRGEDGCPPTAEFKPIGEINNQIAAEQGKFPPECPLKTGRFEPRSWAPSTFAWSASGLCHKPLYFEDVQLERYGHSWGPYLQPVISHGHFFLTVPILPYLMGVDPPCECIYTLGYYRPGSCAPYMLDPLPISARAGLLQAGVWVGGVFLVP